jgi:hypothetical protein
MLMQVILKKSYRKCMSRLRESYNRAISHTQMEHIWEEDKSVLKERW